MKNHSPVVTFLFLATLLPSQASFSQPSSDPALVRSYALYSPSNRPRMVAEWEPAIGALIAWPLSIPKDLVIELAKDTKLWILVEGQESKQDAIQWFTKWRIMPDRIKFITAPQGIDVSWTRDWGPHAVFTPDGTLKLADPKYLYATPVSGLSCTDSLHFIYRDDHGKIELTYTDDKITDYISMFSDFDVINLPFAFTGGNVFTDGQRTGFASCILTNENRYTGVPDEKLFTDVRQILGLEQFNILSNFEEKGIQHIDCFMKLLDEERMIVARPPLDHPAYAVYEGIVTQELMKLKNAYGRPYQILRLDTDRYHAEELAAYTNALILNQTVYVPLFSIAQDSVALRQWADALPGYTVKGFPFPLKDEPYYRPQVHHLYEGIGWTGGDALHCRVRAIWDPDMIYISVDRLPAIVPKAKTYTMNVIIRDYSKGSLVPENLNIRWRVKGQEAWKDVRLVPTALRDQYSAELKGNFAGITIEYFVEAKSNYGSYATMPRTAPKGFYTFSVN